MTPVDIIRMAREAGFQTGELHDRNGQPVAALVRPIGENSCIVELQKFAALVAAAEREECARICDNWSGLDESIGDVFAQRIRSRGMT